MILLDNYGDFLLFGLMHNAIESSSFESYLKRLQSGLSISEYETVSEGYVDSGKNCNILKIIRMKRKAISNE